MMTLMTFVFEHWFFSGLVLVALYIVSCSIWRIGPTEVGLAAPAMKWVTAASVAAQPRQEKK